ncbi:DUF1523 family protein [Clostridium tyrobutyricum]|jgi:hypothetical protein|uniref:Uncharacterized protein n=1 Tax=Clostridium tyrobutyricum DIVETGP TaxID=1408889 RepID=W6N7N5_CLOTY|nr:DUF1523 family protein [Clostridium tyrobutyricum]AND83877.1 hypothetical protein CTK_C06140 [Clostridium tyrobutyricum]ANP68625.1 DUF1523 domain-containing protein [Clostridium tyrobutyricum]MBR9648548.1 DUF1523 family protein [Clostridium tyrobutyricum]MBV4415390.1 DUF1523 family protein [Clostridium tyrobutyricum]MBV4422169.1 DUF1523 family protein [Clostridium tyrobutyricum]
MRKHKALRYKIIAAIVCSIIISVLISLIPHFFRNTYTVIISSKQIEKKSKNKTIYLIYTQMDNGTVKVFKNINSFPELKFNSQDIYGGLRINRKYKIRAYGLRIPLLSSYENIVKVQAVKPYNQWQ